MSLTDLQNRSFRYLSWVIITAFTITLCSIFAVDLRAQESSDTADSALNCSFVGLPVEGSIPLVVSFRDRSTGKITGWSWQFGDGQSSTKQHPVHTYTRPGRYTVNLTIRGPAGMQVYSRGDYVKAKLPAPAVKITVTPRRGFEPLTVRFKQEPTGEIRDQSWIFGDGETSAEKNPTHTYVQPGTYSVSLTVTGPGGSHTETVENLIEVLEEKCGTPPIAESGIDQTVTEGTTVTLSGANSTDLDADIVSFQWEQAFGVPVVLSDRTAPKPTFAAPDVGPNGSVLIFRLKVTDDCGFESTDTCAVNVTEGSDFPVIHTYTSPANTTVAQGGILGPFSATARNNTDSAYSFYLTPSLKTSRANTIAFFTTMFKLAASETARLNNGDDIYIKVPESASPGRYFHYVNVLDSRHRLIDQDGFFFTVGATPVRQATGKSVKFSEIIRVPGVLVVEKNGWQIAIVPKKKRAKKR